MLWLLTFPLLTAVQQALFSFAPGPRWLILSGGISDGSSCYLVIEDVGPFEKGRMTTSFANGCQRLQNVATFADLFW